jgi:hypothetical protein
MLPFDPQLDRTVNLVLRDYGSWDVIHASSAGPLS